LIVPLLLIGLTWPTSGWSLLGFLLYPVQMIRIAKFAKTRTSSGKDALAYGVACMVCKVPEMWGMLKFYRNRLARRQARIIEYK
jgi:hypothetical protein